MKKFTPMLCIILLAICSVFAFAACSKVEFKVNFMVDNEVYATINTNGEEVIKMPTNPTKEGYVFDGWYWDDNYWQRPFTANSLLDAPLSSDMNVYAKWITPDSVQGTNIDISSFEQSGEYEFAIKVPNQTATLSLGNYVAVNSRSSWTLSTDIYGNNTIASKTATLAVGDNLYYILVTADNGTTQLYTLRIRRKPIYNVIFDTNGGTSVAKQEIEEDSFAVAPTSEKVGYTFVSWNYDFSNPITDNTIVVASWSANSYKINYNANGGEIANAYTEVTYADNYTLSIPTKRGYSFGGWYNGNDLIENGKYMTASDITVKAKWDIVNYAISYDLNGGNVDKENPTTYNVESDNIILNDPTQLGFEFVGWTGTDVAEPSKGVIIYSNSIGERNYTANWEFNGYKINYNLNGGINSTDNPIGFTIASSNIYLSNPTKEGYIFGGWFTTETFDTDSKITTVTTGSTGDIDIYAKWTPIKYSVKFNANGGDGLMNNQLFTYDIEQNLDENKYSRYGYSFLGWSDIQDDLSAKYDDAAKLSNMANVQGDIVELFAIWEAISSTVTFDKGISEGGTDSVVATFDQSMPAAVKPVIPFGYAFDGYFDIDGVQYYDSLMVGTKAWDKIADTTLYASFTAKGSTVTFDKQGGTNGTNSVNAVYDSKMPQAVAPTKAGYDFRGYYYQENGQGTQYYDEGMGSVHNWDREYDATLYAYYTPSEFTISFDFNGGECSQNQITATYLEKLPDLSVIPVRTGYIFLGYFDAKNNGTQYYNADLSHDLNWNKTTGAVLYAHWQAIEYQVKFDGNNATSGSMSNEAFVYDASKNLSANAFARVGYSFVNWNTKADGSGVSYTNNQSVKNISSVDGDIITLYAQWNTVSYSINYNLDGGTNNVDNPATYTIEDTVVLKAPSKNGYTFAGWSNGGKIETGCTGTLSFTASWTANTYTVTFDKQGGTSGAETIVVTYGSDMPTCAAPEYSGYDFEGYYDENGTQYYSSTMGSVRVWNKTENATLYARYTGKTYTITFNKQGGSNGSNSVAATYNSTVPSATAPTRTGYTFQGYFDETNGNGKQYYSDSMGRLSVWDKKSAATLYAYWTANTYTVSFNANSGTGTQSNVSATYDSAMPVITTIPTRTGYIFLGYFDSSSGGKKYYNADLTSAADWDKTSATTLYANWQAITYQVRFDGNDATSGSMSNETFTYNVSKALTTNAFSKTGYYFAGWTTNADGSGTSYTDGQSVSNLSSVNNEIIILYAKWAANTYTATLSDTLIEPQFTVSFNLNGASGSIPSQTVTTTNGLTYPSIPTRSGYVFGGWYTTSSCSTLFDFTATVTKDTTIYAKWSSYSSLASTIKYGNNTINIVGGNGSSGTQFFAFIPLVSEKITINVGKNAWIGISSSSPSSGNPYSGSAYNTISYTVTRGTVYYISLQSYKCNTSSSYVGSTYLNIVGSTPSAGGKATGSVVSAITQNVTYDSAFTLSTDCAKDGYTFAGWYDGVGGTGMQYTDKNGNSVKVWDKAANTTLYAKWIAYTLTIEKNIANAGTVSAYDNTNVTAGTSKTITATTNVGYTWIGWYNGEELLTNDLSYTFTMPEQSIVYTAKWSVNQYTITFVSNGGSSVAPITQDYATVVNAPAKPTLEEKSFVGWFDSSLTTEYVFSTMQAADITLYAKWIDYEVALTCNKKTEISINDAIAAETFSATAVDTDGNPVDVTAQITGGSKVVGGKITVRLVAMGLYDIYAVETISNINVYGAPTLTYNTEKDYFNMSDTINASLFGASAIDTLGDAVAVNVSVKEGTYNGGDIVTVVISTTDKTGNETEVEIPNVKVYGTPVITRNIDVVDIKSSDTIGNTLFGISATDSFGAQLDVTTIQYSGTFSGGNTITIKSSTTDSKGNTNYITYSVKVYGLPSISGASTTDFKVEDEITLETLGIVAKDSFAKTLSNVTLELTNGSQISGATLTYLVTATDHLGNVNTKEISGIKIYGTPTITFDTEKTSMKVTDTVNSALLNATAKDSFNDNLSVSVVLNSGTIAAGGNVVTFKLSTTDHLGNYYEVISQNVKVYSSDDITLTYTTTANNIRKLSVGEEFNAQAVNGFGETCETSIVAASGYTLAGGNTINLYIVATDALGNTTRSELITGIKIYDMPTLVYSRDYDYIQNGDSPYALFKVLDSFDKELLFNVETLSGSLEVNETITYRITTTDRVGNDFCQEYTLVVLDTDESILEFFFNGECLGRQRVYKGDNYSFCNMFEGYTFVGWQYNNTLITDSNGDSLFAWDKDSGIYQLTAKTTIITYTVTYNLNGGTNGNNPSTFTIVSAEGGIALNEPTKGTSETIISSEYLGGNYLVTKETTAYTFLGWYTESTFENEVTEITYTGSNVVLYAKWGATTSTSTEIEQVVYTRENNYIYFGMYPQTQVNNSTTKSALKSQAGTLPTSGNSQAWTSYGYYINGSVSNFMWYIDLTYNNEKYRGVYFTSYRSDTSYQDDNGYYTSTVYWFKYEPIKWRILSEANGEALILCEMIIDSQEYYSSSSSLSFSHNGGTGYANNYALSNIRKWLNGTFYNTAFSGLQKAIIQLTTVDNSARSTNPNNDATQWNSGNNPYACANTQDKVFLLSEQEVTNSAYGFNSSRSNQDTAKRKKNTDYAKCQGAKTSTDSSYSGNGYWWLRSPYYGNSFFAWGVYYYGYADDDYIVHNTSYGVVPALKIRL